MVWFATSAEKNLGCLALSLSCRLSRSDLLLHYDKPKAIAEDKDYFIFIFSESHTQAYDKRKMSGGTGVDFRDFIMQKTGLNVQRI